MDFILRPWHIDDLETLVEIANNPGIAGNMTDQFPHPYTRDDGIRFINMALQHEPRNILAIEIAGIAAGGIGIHPQTDIHRLNAEMGYWLAEKYWGQGIATRAIRQMTVYAFQHWDINRIYARPFGTNLASQKALEKAGFSLEARFNKTLIKNGELTDELVYAIRRNTKNDQ